MNRGCPNKKYEPGNAARVISTRTAIKIVVYVAPVYTYDFYARYTNIRATVVLLYVEYLEKKKC